MTELRLTAKIKQQAKKKNNSGNMQLQKQYK